MANCPNSRNHATNRYRREVQGAGRRHQGQITGKNQDAADQKIFFEQAAAFAVKAVGRSEQECRPVKPAFLTSFNFLKFRQIISLIFPDYTITQAF